MTVKLFDELRSTLSIFPKTVALKYCSIVSYILVSNFSYYICHQTVNCVHFRVVLFAYSVIDVQIHATVAEITTTVLLVFVC